MTKMTFDDYDALCDELASVVNNDKDYWPSEKSLNKYVFKDVDMYIDFLIFLSESNNSPKTIDAKRSQKTINKILCEHLVLE